MNWIKIEKHTPDKPEVCGIAHHCKCSKAEAFLALFRFLAYADTQTTDGAIKFLTAEEADDHARLKGFGKALEAVGWVEFDGGEATIINWERHNGKGAKHRAAEAERKRIYREKTKPTEGEE